MTPAFRRILGYLLLAVVITWPLVLGLGTSTVGYPTIDSLDTLMLRGLISELATHPWDLPDTDQVYFPVGYPLLQLTPNLVDHLSGTPLDWLLPFPWSDNLWWLGVLVLNGLAGHHLGRRLGGSDAAGWLCGVGFALCEPVVREANLHHAPQTMVFWAPLYLSALLELREDRSLRTAAWAGLWLGLSGLTYWYLALFLVVGSLFLLPGIPLGCLVVLGAVSGGLAAPALIPYLVFWSELPLTGGDMAPPTVQMESDYSAIPERWRFVAQHGSDPLFWLGRSPLDLSNRVSLALVGAAVVGAGKLRAGTRWGLVAMTLVGSVMVLGPYARWGESLVLVDEGAVSLPFKWFGELHPTLGRLTWPERWGVLVTLGLLPLAARASRPRLWALVIGLECLLFSGNLPLQSISLRHQTCWSALEDASGAVLELPLARTGLMAPWVGVHRRFHRRALVNPILLPPGANYPDAWKDWLEEQELMKWLQRFEEGRWPQEPGADAVRALRAAGVSALAVDAEPGSLLTPGGLSRYKVGLGKHLGPPIDLGCALVWWLDTEVAPPEGIEDGDEWREEATAWKEAHPAPDLDTLIEPTWDAVRHQPFHSGD